MRLQVFGTGGETPVMTRPDGAAFAARWCSDWNSHDLEAVLSHYADDAVFTSPVAVRVTGGDGILRGKQALREYWGAGMGRIPDLHFEILDVYEGVDTIVINYVNQVGNKVCEVLTFDGDLAIIGHGTYMREANPTGLRD
jgi:hypothetical protein